MDSSAPITSTVHPAKEHVITPTLCDQYPLFHDCLSVCLSERFPRFVARFNFRRRRNVRFEVLSRPLFPFLRPRQQGQPGEREHGCQIAISQFQDCVCLALWARRTLAPLCYAAKFDPFLSLDCARVEGGVKGKEGIKFCHLATLRGRAEHLVVTRY